MRSHVLFVALVGALIFLFSSVYAETLSWDFYNDNGALRYHIFGIPALATYDATTPYFVHISTTNQKEYLCFRSYCSSNEVQVLDGDSYITLLTNDQLSNYLYGVDTYCLPSTLFFPDHTSGLTSVARFVKLVCSNAEEYVFKYYLSKNSNYDIELISENVLFEDSDNYAYAAYFLNTSVGEPFELNLYVKDLAANKYVPMTSSFLAELNLNILGSYVLSDITPQFSVSSEPSSDTTYMAFYTAFPETGLPQYSAYFVYLVKLTSNNCFDSADSCISKSFIITPNPYYFTFNIEGVQDENGAYYASQNIHFVFNDFQVLQTKYDFNEYVAFVKVYDEYGEIVFSSQGFDPLSGVDFYVKKDYQGVSFIVEYGVKPSNVGFVYSHNTTLTISSENAYIFNLDVNDLFGEGMIYFVNSSVFLNITPKMYSYIDDQIYEGIENVKVNLSSIKVGEEEEIVNDPITTQLFVFDLKEYYELISSSNESIVALNLSFDVYYEINNDVYSKTFYYEVLVSPNLNISLKPAYSALEPAVIKGEKTLSSVYLMDEILSTFYELDFNAKDSFYEIDLSSNDSVDYGGYYLVLVFVDGYEKYLYVGKINIISPENVYFVIDPRSFDVSYYYEKDVASINFKISNYGKAISLTDIKYYVNNKDLPYVEYSFDDYVFDTLDETYATLYLPLSYANDSIVLVEARYANNTIDSVIVSVYKNLSYDVPYLNIDYEEFYRSGNTLFLSGEIYNPTPKPINVTLKVAVSTSDCPPADFYEKVYEVDEKSDVMFEASAYYNFDRCGDILNITFLLYNNFASYVEIYDTFQYTGKVKELTEDKYYERFMYLTKNVSESYEMYCVERNLSCNDFETLCDVLEGYVYNYSNANYDIAFKEQYSQDYAKAYNAIAKLQECAYADKIKKEFDQLEEEFQKLYLYVCKNYEYVKDGDLRSKIKYSCEHDKHYYSEGTDNLDILRELVNTYQTYYKDVYASTSQPEDIGNDSSDFGILLIILIVFIVIVVVVVYFILKQVKPHGEQIEEVNDEDIYEL